MLRRISLAAASAAMLAVSALPASATVTRPVTHMISFPRLYGVKAWGTYKKTSKGVQINVCAKDNARGIFAVGAVTLASNAGNTRQAQMGAVAIGYHQTVCRSGTLRYTAHLRVFTFIGSNKGTVPKHSRIKVIY
jgi:hypothetical protein